MNSGNLRGVWKIYLVLKQPPDLFVPLNITISFFFNARMALSTVVLLNPSKETILVMFIPLLDLMTSYTISCFSGKSVGSNSLFFCFVISDFSR